VPSSISAALTFVVALLPGALYVWAFERQAGRWGIGLSDRVLRFIGGSAIFHALFSPVSFWVWHSLWPDLRDGAYISPWAWLLPLIYVGVPISTGHLVGRGVRRDARWTHLVVGPDPAPRAWDYVFQHNVDGWIRLRMKSGVWLAGAFANANGRKSYAAGYPEPQDLFLAAAVAVDPDTGEFRLTDDGEVELLPGGLLVRWDEVEYLEFIDAVERNGEADDNADTEDRHDH
jgi:hypothetical protein